MDDLIRLTAFEWLNKQISIHGDVLPREVIAEGFIFQGQKISLVGPKGIWKPKIMEYPLSITTIVNGPYPDTLKGGFLSYRYRGTDPNHNDNIGLRSLISLQKPLVYFLSVSKGKYLAAYPVYIINDNMQDLIFTVAVDDIKVIGQEKYVAEDATFFRRSYITSQVLARVHQKSFRERVLMAYRNQCALCKIRHIELLDAAHIIADKKDIGEPIIQNGLSLCKIHHAAFDNNFIGINPDYTVKVRMDLLEETDGPMLKYGIQSLNNTRLILPSNKRNWPDKGRLEIRFQEFLKAV